jgi:hypothetical protein
MFHKYSKYSVDAIRYLFLSTKTVQGKLTKPEYRLIEVSGRVEQSNSLKIQTDDRKRTCVYLKINASQ